MRGFRKLFRANIKKSVETTRDEIKLTLYVKICDVM